MPIAVTVSKAGAHVDPHCDLNFLHRPDVHWGEARGAIMSGLVMRLRQSAFTICGTAVRLVA
jgi:hypothetical protein